MGFLGKLAKGGLFGLGGLIFGKSKKKARPVMRPVTRDIEREAMDAGDELRRRRGAAADIITGVRGAEPGAGSIGRLVVGS